MASKTFIGVPLYALPLRSCQDDLSRPTAPVSTAENRDNPDYPLLFGQTMTEFLQQPGKSDAGTSLRPVEYATLETSYATEDALTGTKSSPNLTLLWALCLRRGPAPVWKICPSRAPYTCRATRTGAGGDCRHDVTRKRDGLCLTRLSRTTAFLLRTLRSDASGGYDGTRDADHTVTASKVI